MLGGREAWMLDAGWENSLQGRAAAQLLVIRY